MKRKLGTRLVLTRETLRSLDDSALKLAVGEASLICSTASQPKCSGCEGCEHTGNPGG